MEITKTVTAQNRGELRAWFEQNYAAESEIWVVFFKKHTGVPSVTLDEAQEEALCFGWIDGIEKKMDEQRYALRFTPRKNNKNWSEVNIRRVRRLYKAGLMTEPGLMLITFPLDGPDEPPDPRAVPDLPENLLKQLKANPKAWENFQKLPPSQQKIYRGWLTSAKREETQLKRLALALELLEYNCRLGMENPEAILARAKLEVHK
jgi:uncharacterized protein YdeI (YjbR/CyaY-like superfamily)